MSIIIANRQRTKKIDSRLLKRITAELLAELKIERAELGIQLVGAREMAEVNWLYLQHEGSTDVITFDHQQNLDAILISEIERGVDASTLESKAQGAGLQLHGELFICVDDALMQAKEYKTKWQSEVVRYVVHGILHLLGHDDLKADLRRKMKREENRLVTLLATRFSFAKL